MSMRKQSINEAPATRTERDSKGRFLNGHNVGANTRFPPGQSGNPGGSRSAGAYISEWINNLCELTGPELEAIASNRDEPVTLFALFHDSRRINEHRDDGRLMQLQRATRTFVALFVDCATFRL